MYFSLPTLVIQPGSDSLEAPRSHATFPGSKESSCVPFKKDWESSTEMMFLNQILSVCGLQLLKFHEDDFSRPSDLISHQAKSGLD